MTAVLVLAEAPVPGRAKTRLVPPLTYEQAAQVALACLQDTLWAVARCAATRRVVVVDGEPGPWLPGGFEVIPQRGDGLDERLAAAFADAGTPAFQIGMDTPQLTPAVLDDALRRLSDPSVDAVLGPAEDGGCWGIGLKRADARAFLGVPMSSSYTCEQQLARLRGLGLRTGLLGELRGIDYVEDLVQVAGEAPWNSVARLTKTLGPLKTPLTT